MSRDSTDTPRASRLARQGEREGARGSAAGELLLTGDIVSLGGLADIITFMNSARRSGALVVLSGDIKKTLFFAEGNLRMATSSVPEERIGELLFRGGSRFARGEQQTGRAQE